MIEYLRQFRLGEYAIFDFAVTFLGMLLVAPLLTWLCKKIGFKVPIKNWVILGLPIGILVHVLVGNITPMTADFIDLHGHYLLKIFIVVLIFLGLRGIKRK
ncbi:MAG: hypothetical protein Q8P90_02530 [bacterium]|nr:hypothetical protein [bacterium]